MNTNVSTHPFHYQSTPGARNATNTIKTTKTPKIRKTIDTIDTIDTMEKEKEEIVKNIPAHHIRPRPYQRSSKLQHHWEDECKGDASWAKRFFYMGTVSLLVALCLLGM